MHSIAKTYYGYDLKCFEKHINAACNTKKTRDTETIVMVFLFQRLYSFCSCVKTEISGRVQQLQISTENKMADKKSTLTLMMNLDAKNE